MPAAIEILPTSRFATRDSPFDTPLFAGASFRIGRFDASPDHPDFADSGPTQGHLFVFPRSRVWIQHDGERPFASDPSTVTFYNRGQGYRRRAISPEGDRCVWFAVEPGLLDEALAALGAPPGTPERPFRCTHGPGDAASWALHDLLVRHLQGPAPSAWLAEEIALELLLRVGGAALTSLRRPTPSPRHQRLLEVARLAIGERACDPSFSLADLAATAGCSTFHLCRVFRAATGTTLHAYRQRLRLRRAVERLADPQVDLTALALDLGFSSHSHFSHCFRRAFGATPRSVRGAPKAPRLACLARQLTRHDAEDFARGER